LIVGRSQQGFPEHTDDGQCKETQSPEVMETGTDDVYSQRADRAVAL
jgi:hypothetical protein